MDKRHISDIFNDKKGQEDTSIVPMRLVYSLLAPLLAFILFMIFASIKEGYLK